MKVLFIHQNFPGQFVHLAAQLARKRQNQVVALSIYKQAVPPGVDLRCYTMLRRAVPETHPLLQDQEAKVMRAEACAAAALQLKREGFVPDVVVAHPGWGEALFIKDVFPQARLVVYCEFYYAAEGRDVGFDAEFPPLSFQQRCQLRMRNATNLLSLDACDVAISPTQWQRDTYPAALQSRIEVIHDGIDLERLRPNPAARLRLAANGSHAEICLKPGDEVLSYVARNLEPVRGFHQLMRLLPQVLRQRPKAHVVIVGGDDVSYGAAAPDGQSWRAHMLREVGDQLDWSRVHFVGKLPYASYLDLLNVSKVHAYWTTPFVLSWSLLEAAMHGVPVVASDTPPVAEYAGSLGLITPGFFDQDAFAGALIQQLASQPKARKNRAIVESIDLPRCVERWLKLMA